MDSLTGSFNREKRPPLFLLTYSYSYPKEQQSAHVASIKLLLAHGADPNLEQRGRTPFINVCLWTKRLNESEDIVLRVMLEEYNANVTVPKGKTTPLHPGRRNYPKPGEGEGD